MWCAPTGLGGETSEVALRLVRLWKSCTAALGRGPSLHLGFFTLGEDLGVQAKMTALLQGKIRPECLIVFCVFLGHFSP